MTARETAPFGAVAKLATSGQCPDKLVAQAIAPLNPRTALFRGVPISRQAQTPPTAACVEWMRDGVFLLPVLGAG
ncbi:hypothetical protein H0A64_05220 [Alcaligenaceae bacterium]|nr:hypothetical protein [Alcaligenaceae bacterium]